MSDSPTELTIELDEHTRELLSRYADDRQTDEREVASELLRLAVMNAAMTPEEGAKLFDSIPGAWERVQRGSEQAERGETIPLDELL